MWVKIAGNYSINLNQAERIIVYVVKEPDMTITDSPVPAQNVTRVDVEALFSDERKCTLASFLVSPDCGPYQAETKADAVFARIMRAVGDKDAMIDLTQLDNPVPSVPVLLNTPTAANPIRFAM